MKIRNLFDGVGRLLLKDPIISALMATVVLVALLQAAFGPLKRPGKSAPPSLPPLHWVGLRVDGLTLAIPIPGTNVSVWMLSDTNR